MLNVFAKIFGNKNDREVKNIKKEQMLLQALKVNMKN